MAPRKVNCGKCGERLPISYSTGGPRQPCPQCGGTAINISVHAGATAKPSAAASYVVSATNEASGKLRQVEAAVAAVEVAVDKNDAALALHAVKQALEPIQELAHCMRDGDWAQTDWTAAQKTLWHAHLGARNVAHHQTSRLVAIHSEDQRAERLRWAPFTPASIAELRSPEQQAALPTIAGDAVLPNLRELVRLLRSSVV